MVAFLSVPPFHDVVYFHGSLYIPFFNTVPVELLRNESWGAAFNATTRNT